MHIQDGFLAPGVSLGMGAASVVPVTWRARRAQGETEEGRAPLLAFTLGPASAIIVMTAILALSLALFSRL